MTLRLVLALCWTILSSGSATPLTWMSAYMIFFVTRKPRDHDPHGDGVFLGNDWHRMSLFFSRYTFDYPELRIPVMAASVFAGMFSRGVSQMAHWRLPSALCWR